MKRWKKALSGLLMAALMVTGISFPENVFAVSTGMDGLPSVVNSGIGKIVNKDSVIDGSYNFTPVIGSETKITFDAVIEVDHGITIFAKMQKDMRKHALRGGNWLIHRGGQIYVPLFHMRT